ncbi:MAG: hypothetical protein R3C49_16150 [Planctomycetaceae bacterium]
MFRLALLWQLMAAAVAIVLVSECADAQTSYPMLMGLSPVAAQRGRTSEHVLESRYTMFGADRVIVTGEGVSAEVVSPMKPDKDGKEPSLTKITLRVSVAEDALPGVRDVESVEAPQLAPAP